MSVKRLQPESGRITPRGRALPSPRGIPGEDEALARYALEGLSTKVMAAEYRITLPDETVLAAELDRTRQAMEDGGDAL